MRAALRGTLERLLARQLLLRLRCVGRADTSNRTRLPLGCRLLQQINSNDPRSCVPALLCGPSTRCNAHQPEPHKSRLCLPLTATEPRLSSPKIEQAHPRAIASAGKCALIPCEAYYRTHQPSASTQLEGCIEAASTARQMRQRNGGRLSLWRPLAGWSLLLIPKASH